MPRRRAAVAVTLGLVALGATGIGTLATGGDDGLLRLWDVNLGRERLAVEWHLDGVCAVAFAPDGLTVASGSFDGSVKLWPREVLRPLLRQGVHDDRVL